MAFLSSVLVTIAATATCLPPFWGGIFVGGTDREQVERLIGRGEFFANESGVKVSYHVDSDREVTVRIEYGTDELVQILEVIEGDSVPDSIVFGCEMVSGALDPPWRFGGLGELQFGASLESVLTNMGEPTTRIDHEDGSFTIVYPSACSCELESGISFTIDNGRMVKVTYWENFG